MRYTDSIPTMQELLSIIKHMRSNASPGPDGLNAAFYKSVWPWICQDIYQMVYDFYTQAFLIPQIIKPTLFLFLKRCNPLFHRILVLELTGSLAVDRHRVELLGVMDVEDEVTMSRCGGGGVLQWSFPSLTTAPSRSD